MLIKFHILVYEILHRISDLYILLLFWGYSQLFLLGRWAICLVMVSICLPIWHWDILSLLYFSFNNIPGTSTLEHGVIWHCGYKFYGNRDSTITQCSTKYDFSANIDAFFLPWITICVGFFVSLSIVYLVL